MFGPLKLRAKGAVGDITQRRVASAKDTARVLAATSTTGAPLRTEPTLLPQPPAATVSLVTQFMYVPRPECPAPTPSPPWSPA